MSTPQRRDGPDLISQILEDPHRFGFFQAVRLLEVWLEERDGRGTDIVPDALRFRNSTALGFPASEIERLRLVAQGVPEDESHRAAGVELTPAFMGLLGASGALPLVYTEQILQREMQARDTSARSFLDLFSHRAVALFYAAWKKSRLQWQYHPTRPNAFTQMALALSGMGQRGLQDRLQAQSGGVHDESLGYFAGALQQRTLSAGQLQHVLHGYLGVPVRVEQFVGRWYRLPMAARWTLGQTNGGLGRNAVLGERVWQRDLCVRLRIGPLDRSRFHRFLPGAPGALALRELLRTMCGVSLEFEINLELEASAVEGTVLDTGRSPLWGRLGWDTYLQTAPSTVHRSDVRYDIEPAVVA